MRRAFPGRFGVSLDKKEATLMDKLTELADLNARLIALKREL
jgi:hypothetical protein